jgi:hypothetical protein
MVNTIYDSPSTLFNDHQRCEGANESQFGLDLRVRECGFRHFPLAGLAEEICRGGKRVALPSRLIS